MGATLPLFSNSRCPNLRGFSGGAFAGNIAMMCDTILLDHGNRKRLLEAPASHPSYVIYRFLRSGAPISAVEANGAFGAGEFSGVRLTIIFRLGTFDLLITTWVEVMSQHGAPCDKYYGVQVHYLITEEKRCLGLANSSWHRIILGPEKHTRLSKAKGKSKLLGLCLYSI